MFSGCCDNIWNVIPKIEKRIQIGRFVCSNKSKNRMAITRFLYCEIIATFNGKGIVTLLLFSVLFFFGLAKFDHVLITWCYSFTLYLMCHVLVCSSYLVWMLCLSCADVVMVWMRRYLPSWMSCGNWILIVWSPGRITSSQRRYRHSFQAFVCVLRMRACVFSPETQLPHQQW